MGSVSMETSVDDSESSRGINPETNKQKKISGRVQSLTPSLYFFFLFLIFLLNAVFELFVVVMYFFCHYSHQQAWSTVTQKKKMLMSCLWRPKRKRKGIAYLHQEVWGDSTFFWQSSQSSYMSVSRLSFLVICDMISDSLILSDLKTSVEIKLSHNTDRIKGGRTPCVWSGSLVSVSVCVINYRFPRCDLSSKNSLRSPPSSDWKHWQAEHHLLSGFLHSCKLFPP